MIERHPLTLPPLNHPSPSTPSPYPFILLTAYPNLLFFHVTHLTLLVNLSFRHPFHVPRLPQTNVKYLLSPFLSRLLLLPHHTAFEVTHCSICPSLQKPPRVFQRYSICHCCYSLDFLILKISMFTSIRQGRHYRALLPVRNYSFQSS